MLDKETKGKFEGLGNHWSAVLDDGDLDLAKVASQIVEAKNSTVKKAGNFSGILSFEGPLKGFALIKINSENAELWSAYPFLQISNPVSVSVEKIDEWSNGGEAVIWGSIGPVSVSFFDTLYFCNKGKYKVGEAYTFHLGAIAHSFEKRTQDLVIEPTEGPLKGEKLYTQKMTSFMPAHDYGGEFTFICPFVSFSGQDSQFEESFSIFPYYIMSADTDSALFTAPMYVNKKLVKGDIQANDSVQGTAWLQGYLIDSFREDWTVNPESSHA